jgi:hypothetical protein
MIAVATREPVLEAAGAEPQMRADGGASVEAEQSDYSDERPDDCDCWGPEQELPCWPCYRDDFEEPNPAPEVSDK